MLNGGDPGGATGPEALAGEEMHPIPKRLQRYWSEAL